MLPRAVEREAAADADVAEQLPRRGSTVAKFMSASPMSSVFPSIIAAAARAGSRRASRRLERADDEVRPEHSHLERVGRARQADRDLEPADDVVRVLGVEDPDAAAERPPASLERLERELRVGPGKHESARTSSLRSHAPRKTGS